MKRRWFSLLSIMLAVVLVGTVTPGCPEDTELTVFVQPREVEPGGVIDITGLVLPPQKTELWINDELGPYYTDEKGIFTITLTIKPQTPEGEYRMTVKAPGLGLVGSANFIVVAGASVPLVMLERVAPNNLDLPGETAQSMATPAEGAVVENGGLTLYIPPGAVTTETPVAVTLFSEAPQSTSTAWEGATGAFAVGDFFDLGPDGQQFAQPVLVTIPYFEELFPDGVDETSVCLAYYNGQDWIAFEGYVDTVNNTISFKTRAFPGVHIVSVVAVKVLALVLGVGVLIYRSYDRAIQGDAYKYVTPDDPEVKKYAALTELSYNGASANEFTNIYHNPSFADTLADGVIKFRVSKELQDVYSNEVRTIRWYKPAEYFERGMVGDCKHISLTLCSIFRSEGVPAKCVSGYQDGKDHCWVEVMLGGKPFCVADKGHMLPLEKAYEDYNLTVPKVGFFRGGLGYMWDEKSQEIYKQKWWINKLGVSVDPIVVSPGGQYEVVVDTFTRDTVDIEVVVDYPDDRSDTGKGTTVEGKVTVPMTLKQDAVKGTYRVTAKLTARPDLIGTASFTVETATPSLSEVNYIEFGFSVEALWKVVEEGIPTEVTSDASVSFGAYGSFSGNVFTGTKISEGGTLTLKVTLNSTKIMLGDPSWMVTKVSLTSAGNPQEGSLVFFAHDIPMQKGGFQFLSQGTEACSHIDSLELRTVEGGNWAAVKRYWCDDSSGIAIRLFADYRE